MGVTRLKRKGRKNRNVSASRQFSIKHLTATPVIKNVDLEELKKQFSAPMPAAKKETPAPKAEAPAVEAAAPVAEAPAKELRRQGQADLHRPAVQHWQGLRIPGQLSGQHKKLP